MLGIFPNMGPSCEEAAFTPSFAHSNPASAETVSSQELRWQPADEAVERLESVEVRLHSESRNRACVYEIHEKLSDSKAELQKTFAWGTSHACLELHASLPQQLQAIHPRETCKAAGEAFRALAPRGS